MRSLLAAVCFLSGLAGLVYHVVWQRILTLHYGVSSISIALVVSVTMLGLGLGALLGGAIADRLRRRVGLYVLIEGALAGFGLMSVPFANWLGDTASGGPIPVALLSMVAFLTLPTMLIGMTLPLLVRIFQELSESFFESVSFLYFLSSLGAAAGAVVSSYVLISFLGLAGALYVAAGVHGMLAFLIAGSVRRSPTRQTGGPAPHPPSRVSSRTWAGAYVAVFVTGYLAIGYEVVWFRLIGVLNKGSSYSFSSTLAVYLLGLAIGSSAMGRLLRRRPGLDRRGLFCLAQGGVAGVVLATTAAFVWLIQNTGFERVVRTSFEIRQHPSLDVAGGFLPTLLGAADVFLWPCVFVLLPTVLMGASFPLISDLVRTRADHDGRAVGRVLFCGTMGNLAGGLLTGFVLMPWLGTERTLALFTIVGSIYLLWARRPSGAPLSFSVRCAGVATVAAVAAFALPAPTGIWQVVHPPPGKAERFINEGAHGVVVTDVEGDRVESFIDGVRHGGRATVDPESEVAEMAALTPAIESALVIGFSTGSTVEALTNLRGIRRVTVAEVNPDLLANLRRVPRLRSLLSDPIVEVVIEDGRRFLQRHDERYDLILLDARHHSASYSNNLDSTEFFRLVGRHLTPGGTFRVSLDEFRVLPKTVATVFPHLRHYGRTLGRGEFMIASTAPLERDPVRFERAFRRILGDHPAALPEPAWSLRGERGYALAQGAGYPTNRDMRPVSEYYVGLDVRERLGNPALLRLIDAWNVWRYAPSESDAVAASTQ